MIEMKSIKTHKHYVREFEGMGKGLVLLKMEPAVKNYGYNYHLFYQNGRKPPLDIAIYPNDFSIEYISYFLQDEHVTPRHAMPDICYSDKSLSLYSDDFSIDHTNINFNKNFDAYLVGKSLFIIEDKVAGPLYGYALSASDYILLDNEQNIAGVAFHNITDEEKAVLAESNVL